MRVAAAPPAVLRAVAAQGRSASGLFFTGVFYSHSKITQCNAITQTVLSEVLNTVLWFRLVVASSCVNIEKTVNLFVGVHCYFSLRIELW